MSLAKTSSGGGERQRNGNAEDVQLLILLIRDAEAIHIAIVSNHIKIFLHQESENAESRFGAVG